MTGFLADRFDQLAASAGLPFNRIEPLHGQRRRLGNRHDGNGRAWLELELLDPDTIWLTLCDDVVVEYWGNQSLPAVLEVARRVFWEPVSIVYTGGRFPDIYALFEITEGGLMTLPDRNDPNPPTTWVRERYRPISAGR